MLALLRTRRWIGFTTIVVLAIIAFGLLSRWQWSRAEEKRQERTTVTAAMTAKTRPLAEAIAAAPRGEWELASATGTWVPASQVLVRRRPLDAKNGFWVMTLLQLPDGRAVWANRGWMAATGGATDVVQGPAPAAGTVSVTGFVRQFEDVPAQADLPTGQVAGASLAALPHTSALLPVYLQVYEPAQDGLTPLPGPEIDEGRNVSYAIQWILFALVAIAGWAYLLRREARDTSPTASVEA